MGEFWDRYVRRREVVLRCTTVTPMFLGGADQEAEWRTAPFKGLLRYWWRVTHRGRDPLTQESALFGTAGESGEDKSGKSLILVRVVGNGGTKRDQLPEVKQIEHPEVRSKDPSRDKQVDPLLYLAGIGLLSTKREVKRSYFPPGCDFSLSVSFPLSCKRNMEQVMALLSAFGAIGSRCRNGWGSFQVKEGGPPKGSALAALKECTVADWKTGFEQDYPNCLGRDERGLLLWKTKDKSSWPQAMRELADAYVGVRARHLGTGLERLNPNGKEWPDERHLLGFPLTRHSASNMSKWGSTARHASPLRFVVKKGDNGYRGLVVHVPHAHSKQMELPTHVNQVEVWKKVHRKLDRLLSRARYEDCL